MRRRTQIVAWSLILLGLLLAIAAVVFTLLNGSNVAEELEWGSGGLAGVLFQAVPGAAFLSVGGLLALRRPQNSVGWLCLAIALFWISDAAMQAISKWAIYQGMLTVATWFGILGALWVPALGLSGTHLPLRLPDGLLLSRRWRWYSWFCTVVLLIVYVLEITVSDRLVAGIPQTQNPLGSETIQSLSPLFVLFPLSFVGAITSLVLRYRRADGVERLQLRWLAFGGVLFLVVFVTALALISTVVPDESSLFAALGNVTFIAYTAIPIAIGIAVLRYRLYDIDTLINRTLVYVPLTVILAALFAIAQDVSRRFLSGFWGENSAASVALTTLILVAVFEPLKTAIGQVVDKFAKQIPDPARTVRKFREKILQRVMRVNADEIARQLLEEVVHGFGVSSGAVYLAGEDDAQPAHATRNWKGLPELTIPITSAVDAPELGILALGPQRAGGGYTERQRKMLQEMARVVGAAIEQDGQVTPLQKPVHHD